MVTEVHYSKSGIVNSNVNVNNTAGNTVIITASEYMAMPITERLNYNGGIKVKCKECKQAYTDYARRTPINFDLSVCPFCNNINYFTFSHNRKRIWERTDTNSATVLSFLLRKDIPANAECEVTIRFKDISALKEFLMHNEIKDMDVRLIF